MATALTPLAILRRARALIADPKCWIKGAFRRKIRNGPVCYCASGAISAASGCRMSSQLIRSIPPAAHDARLEALFILIDAIPRNRHELSVGAYNDASIPSTAHADVLAWFDRAIARAKKRT